MQQRDAPDRRPARAGLGRDRREPGDDLLVVGLVGQVLDPLATFGVVAHGAAEQHHGAAVGPHGPVVGLADRQLVVGERQPVVAVVGREHGRIVAPDASTAIRAAPAPAAARDLRARRCHYAAPPWIAPRSRPTSVRGVIPSELGPPSHEPTSTGGRVLIATTATLSLLLIGLLVLSMTPDRGGATGGRAGDERRSRRPGPAALEQPRSRWSRPLGDEGWAVTTSDAVGARAGLMSARLPSGDVVDVEIVRRDAESGRDAGVAARS